VSEAGPWGTFGFLPVTDGTFIQQLPSQQLLSKALKGRRLLSGNNANEGIPLSPPTAKTLRAFRNYISTTFPHFSSADKAALEAKYSYEGDNQDMNPSAPLFDTAGTSYPTAINQSSFATGQQQRVFNVFAEYAFDCPSYWLASAFPQAWKYQISVPPAYHGFDLNAYWKGKAAFPGSDFKHAFQTMWGSFITTNTPIISVGDARASKANATVPVGAGGKIAWPLWTEAQPVLMNFNTTGGVPVWNNVTANLKYRVYTDPGVTNVFQLADATKWEGGRGARCRWWRGQAKKVPY
jgi:carboxylesterase type B